MVQTKRDRGKKKKSGRNKWPVHAPPPQRDKQPLVSRTNTDRLSESLSLWYDEAQTARESPLRRRESSQTGTEPESDVQLKSHHTSCPTGQTDPDAGRTVSMGGFPLEQLLSCFVYSAPQKKKKGHSLFLVQRLKRCLNLPTTLDEDSLKTSGW